jgi:hypothetical protein
MNNKKLTMENTQEYINAISEQRHLHNIGGPSSRIRSEKITSSIFDSETLKTQSEIHSLNIPNEVDDIEEWVISLYETNAFFDWEQIEAKIKLPTVRMLVLPAKITDRKSISRYEMFRSAVILSKCNSNFYAPDSPMIFTRNRLNRNIELIKINLNSYYGMD